jgi:hypothetical protein
MLKVKKVKILHLKYANFGHDQNLFLVSILFDTIVTKILFVWTIFYREIFFGVKTKIKIDPKILLHPVEITKKSSKN